MEYPDTDEDSDAATESESDADRDADRDADADQAWPAGLWPERHTDMTDEEYLATLTVLRRFLRDASDRGWEH
ncbi:hypothetical protein [Streptomyces sp. NPDC059564]|uniref:hypothetical protein n=1 Tax=Streptomyces sp. NPDC059564 TaxID=3346865 RepID=UPI0036758748